jgi:hypothetical protein
LPCPSSIVGAFLAASTGIVGATVVTMGLLALPTMLRNNYSPGLATGVIAASGTLGQIIPPSIVIVLLGTLVGDLYATGQETRAQLAGCNDALTYLVSRRCCRWARCSRRRCCRGCSWPVSMPPTPSVLPSCAPRTPRRSSSPAPKANR